MTDSFNEIISILLQNLGSRKEIDQYLREFTKVGSTKFAVVKVGGGIVEDSLEELASSLAFLRQVGLFPIVMHGAGPQLNRAFQEAGVVTKVVDGLRVTTPETLAIVRQTLQAVNFKLVDRLEAYKVRARPIISGVFEAEIKDEAKWGYVGEVARVDLQAIEAAIQNGQLPIVSCLGETATGQIVNINADVAARELALAVEPYKVIFLTPTGGLLDGHGDLIPAVNLIEDFDALMEAEWLNGGMRLKLAEVKRLLDQLPAASSVSMTTPQHLATELFTHRGSGTLIRRGQSVELHRSFADVDTVQLRDLIESSFGKPLAADYFETRQVEQILLTHDYSAAAIVTREGNEFYLDKFAVTAQAQGSGLGASLWSRLHAAVPRLFWRARPDNRIASWYFGQAAGTHRTDDWVVFWYGLESRNEIEWCIECALRKEPSLLEMVASAGGESADG